MNAPAAPQLLAQSILVTRIRPSCTIVQGLRRGRFTDENIKPLADSVRTQGILQPLLVRPHKDQFELVAGERRLRAAQVAGLDTVPCYIRELTDEQVLEAQLVENLQRDGLTAIEEAQGYFDLRKLTGKTADDVAAQIGKSRSYVYARLKLLDLAEAVRVALDGGQIDESKALLIARLPHPKLQEKALRLMEGDYYSFRRMSEQLRRDMLKSLDKVPFSLDDDRLDIQIEVAGQTRKTKHWITAPACNACEHNSSTDAELEAAIGANVCINVDCLRQKIDCAEQRKIDAAKAAGKTVLEGDEAKSVVGTYGVEDGYIMLDEECYDYEPPGRKDTHDYDDEAVTPTYRELLKDAKLDPILVKHPKHGVIEVVKAETVAKPLKALGVEVFIPGEDDSQPGETDEQRKAREAKEKEKRELDQAVHQATLHAVFGKWKLPLKRADIDLLAESVAGYAIKRAAEAVGLTVTSFNKLKDEELMRLMILGMIVDPYHTDRLKSIADSRGIDVKAIRADIIKTRKAASTPSKAAAPAAPKPAKKKATKK